MGYVRVKDKATRHELSVTESDYESNADAFELLQKPATQADGQPLPPKHYKPLSSKSGQTADSEKEKQ